MWERVCACYNKSWSTNICGIKHHSPI